MKDITRRESMQFCARTALLAGASTLLSSCGGGSGAPLPSAGGGSATVHAVLGDALGELPDMAAQAVRILGIGPNALRGARVFIKPNFVFLGIFEGFLAETGECVKPEIVAAVAEQCLLSGAARVSIGDGAQGIQWSWDSVGFLPGNTFHGAANLAAAVDYLNTRYGDRVELLCLNQVDDWVRIPSSCRDPRFAEGLLVARRFHEADHVISLPVLKAHQWADITVAMKCLLGVTPLVPYQMVGEPSRGVIHSAYAETVCGGVAGAGVVGAYMDIFASRKEAGKQDFAIVDASIGLEKNGPHRWDDLIPIALPGSGGITIDFKQRTRAGKYFLLAGTDLVATDAIAARITGYDPETMKQLAIARNLGLGETRNVTLRGASVEDLSVPDWVRAEPLDEWGVAAPALASELGHAGRVRSLSANHLLSLACPTAMVCLYRWLQRRKGRVAELGGIAPSAVRASGGMAPSDAGTPAHRKAADSAGDRSAS